MKHTRCPVILGGMVALITGQYAKIKGDFLRLSTYMGKCIAAIEYSKNDQNECVF